MDIEAQGKAILDQLKNNRVQPPPERGNLYQHLSPPPRPVSGTQHGVVSPPQSRDGTAGFRYYTPKPPMGTVLVPNSSPISQPQNIYPSQPLQYHPYEPPTSGYRNGNTWGQSNWNGVDLFAYGNGASRSPDANFSRSFTSGERRLPDDHDVAESGPPRKRLNIGESYGEGNVYGVQSPEILRPGQRRRLMNSVNGVVGSPQSSDDSFPDGSALVASMAPKSRIVRGQRPGPTHGSPSTTSKKTDSDEKLTKFIMINPHEPRGRVIAAYRQCGGDISKATHLLLSPAFQPDISSIPVSSPSTPSVSGRVKEVDEEREASRAAAKARAMNSSIYRNRQMLETGHGSATSTPPSISTVAPPSPSSPAVAPRPALRRLKKRVLDSGSEAEAGPESDSEVEIIKEGTWSQIKAEGYYEAKALDSFNSLVSDALMELSGCTLEQAQHIIALRPFGSVDDLEHRLGQGRKRAGPAGLSPRIFQEAVDIYQGYGSVDSILEDCERIGAELRSEIASWSHKGNGKGKGKEKEKIEDDSPTLLEEDQEDGALSLHSLAVSGDDNGFLVKSPALLSKDIQLKNYQLLGVNWLNLLYMKGYSCILADEMGLGKTVQVISFFAHLKEKGGRGPHLVVVPSSTLENWCREFERFAPDISVQTYYAGKEQRPLLRQTLLDTRQSRSKNGKGWEVLITTYNLANGDDRDRKFFRRIHWNTCVFDEGHILKNFQSQRYTALMKIESKWKLLLTGTPLQNNLQELVSLMNFILPHQFEETMESLRTVFKVKGDSKITLLAEGRVSRAKKMMTPFVLRRRKDQVLKDLPKKTERIEWCDLTSAQKTIYRDALRRSRKTVFDLEKEDTATNSKSKSKSTKKTTKTKEKVYLENSSNVLMDLRKAASHPMLFRTRFTDKTLSSITNVLLKEPDFKKRGAIYQYVKEDMEVMTDAELQVFCGTYKSTRKYLQDEDCYLNAGKVKVMLKLLEKYQKEGRRCLIFSQFTQILDILQVILKHKSIRYLVLTGSTPVDVRQALVDEFTEDDGIPVFLLSTKAGGMGINLTAASVVILFDQDFNPHNDKQAADRAYRIGQKRDVEIVKLISRGTIEEDMLRLGHTKLALDEAVAGDAEDVEGGEGKQEKIMKKSLMETLRKKFEQEDQGGLSDNASPASSPVRVASPEPTTAAAKSEVIEIDSGSDLTDLDDT